MFFFLVQALDTFATKLIENEHYASDDVAARRDAVSYSSSQILLKILKLVQYAKM